MRYIKIIFLVLFAYFITASFYGNYISFTINIGSIWVNLKYFYVLILGFLVSFIGFFSKKILYASLSIIILLLVLLLFDSLASLKYHSLLLFLLNVLLFTFIITRTCNE